MPGSQRNLVESDNVKSKAWNVLRTVRIGTHQTLRHLLAELPDRQVRITNQDVLDFSIKHPQREVKLVAPKVCQLGFSKEPISAGKIIERGLKHPQLSRSPVGALVQLRQQYHNQPLGDTCVGSHKPIDSDSVDKLLAVKRSMGSLRTILAYPGNEAEYGLDHRFVFEVYKNL